MNLFNKLVTEALKNQPHLSSLRIVVEKELLHHDILRVMRDNNLTSGLTFIGGTCLRCCYGGIRLSEDLDFTGGHNFSRDKLSTMGKILTQNLQNKYGLDVIVSEPIEDKQNVDTWKVKVETRPEARHMPMQRINLDICSLPSYEKIPMMLLNPYGIDLGTSGLVIQAQSREEIYTDKLLAFALRPNRLKYRDLWDIVWLHSQSVKPRLELLPHKLKDRHCTASHFLNLFDTRLQLLKQDPKIAVEFKKEMLRFLPTEHIQKTLEQEGLWGLVASLIEGFSEHLRKVI